MVAVSLRTGGVMGPETARMIQMKLAASWVCDDEEDCEDGSDEHQQCPGRTCSSQQFTCSNGQCVPSAYRCDRVEDCTDGTDERACPLYIFPHMGQYLPVLMLMCRPGPSQRRKEPKNKATVSVSTQAVTEEKETKGAISISTQTVTEAEQPKPVAVAPVQKKKSKSKSVRIMTDEDVAGPSHPAEETEPEIITRSLSLGELRDLRREFTHQTNESILTWLLRIWDAAANDTILDGSEARQLGSLSRDVVIDQGIGRTQQTLSLWWRLLTSVRDRYLCKEDLQVHQGKWSTMEQGTRCLRELAVLEIIFLRRREIS
ncbi:hypothetical protein DUI87_04466 [Hirundo rustica rustica]|uniref:Uncharacterized protein n=1 Tax=Hirundo rustica rustica TaxID=333673 RepID=A0A3M0L3X4_HIRRU|nr:hypothetical protein DUI87_04466 [Hirundo rustica rustica]